MKKLSALIITCCFAVVLCGKTPVVLQQGYWRGVLALNDSVDLPFHFTLEKNKTGTTLTIHNGAENIACTVQEIDDSINWKMPVYDSFFLCIKDNDSSFHGYWFDHTTRKQVVVPFHAFAHRPRFAMAQVPPTRPYDGQWEIFLSPGTADSVHALGRFSQAGAAATGTIIEPGGDYGYLEGTVGSDGQLYLSTFNGTHAFYFRARKKNDGTLEGTFWSVGHHAERWTARRNAAFHLPDAATMASVSDSAAVDFTFLDLKGRPVSLHDSKYKNKVVIVQLVATWCPHCTDETRDFAALYDQYHDKGFEIVAIAFERPDDPAQARANVERLKAATQAKYDFLVTNNAGREEVAGHLPFLKGFVAFPTTMMLDRHGKVRYVYTGYSGPATGSAHDKLVEDMRAQVKLLISEKP